MVAPQADQEGARMRQMEGLRKGRRTAGSRSYGEKLRPSEFDRLGLGEKIFEMYVSGKSRRVIAEDLKKITGRDFPMSTIGEYILRRKGEAKAAAYKGDREAAEKNEGLESLFKTAEKLKELCEKLEKEFNAALAEKDRGGMAKLAAQIIDILKHIDKRLGHVQDRTNIQLNFAQVSMHVQSSLLALERDGYIKILKLPPTLVRQRMGDPAPGQGAIAIAAGGGISAEAGENGEETPAPADDEEDENGGR